MRVIWCEAVSGGTACGKSAGYLLSMGCVHEHISTDVPVCLDCFRLWLQLDALQLEGVCTACEDDEDRPHYCPVHATLAGTL